MKTTSAFIIAAFIASTVYAQTGEAPCLSIPDTELRIAAGNGWSFGAGNRIKVLADEVPGQTIIPPA